MVLRRDNALHTLKGEPNEMQAESTHFSARSSNSPRRGKLAASCKEFCIYAVLKGACAGSSPAAGTNPKVTTENTDDTEERRLT